jgi:hypothetical protein
VKIVTLCGDWGYEEYTDNFIMPPTNWYDLETNESTIDFLTRFLHLGGDFPGRCLRHSMEDYDADEMHDDPKHVQHSSTRLIRRACEAFCTGKLRHLEKLEGLIPA